jgi:hypothetical protein
MRYRRDQQHVWAIAIEIEIFSDVLTRYRGREWTEALPIFNAEIELTLQP